MASLIHAVAHGFVADDPIYFGNLVPSNAGPAEGVTYYVLAAGLTADDFEFSDSPGGTPIDLDFDIEEGIVSKLAVYTPITDPTDVMAPPVALDPPTDLTLTSATELDADGHTVVRLDVTLVQPTSATLRHSIVTITPAVGEDIKVIIPAGQTAGAVHGVQAGILYSAVAYAYDTFGLVSAASNTDTVTPAGDTTAPAQVTGAQAFGAILGMIVRWDSSAATDLSHYEVDMDDNSGFTSPDTYKVKTTVLGLQQIAAGTYYFRIRAVDLSANAGTYSSTVSATSRTVQTADLTDALITTAKLVAGAVTDVELASAAVTAAKIAVDAVTAPAIAASAVGNSELAAGAVTAAKITAGTITSNEIAALTIVAANIAAGTITAAKIAAGTITSNEIAALTIIAANIAAGTITGAKIAAGTITAANIAADTITATEIAADAITANELAALAVTTAKLDANAVTAAKIAASAVTADKIAAGSITISKLGAEERGNVGSEFFTDFTDTSMWSNAQGGGGGLTATSVSDAQAGGYVGRSGDNAGNDEFWAQRNDGLLIPFDPNALYRVHVRVRRNSGTGQLYAGVEGVAADGTTLVNVSGSNSFSSQHYVAAAGVAPGASFTDYVGYIKGTSGTPTGGTAHANPASPATVHSNVRYIRPMFLLNYTGATGQMDIDIFEITRVDNTSVVNSDSSVVIDSSGITIINGKLSFKDTYGTTAMDGGGFGTEWTTFIRTGFYNSEFTKGDTSDIAVTETGSGSGLSNYLASLTTHLPYWVVAASGGVLKIVSDSTASGGFAIQSTATVAGQTNRWYQDAPIVPGKKYLVRLNQRWTRTAGDFALNQYYSWRDSTHAIIGSRIGGGLTFSATRSAYLLDTDAGIPLAIGAAPANAVYLRYEVEIVHNNTGTTYWLSDISLVEANQDTAFRGAAVHRSTTQTLTTGVAAAITFDTEDTDTEAMFTASSTTVTIKLTGWYRITGTMGFTGAAGGTRRIMGILINGAIPTIPDGEMTVVTGGNAFDMHTGKSITMLLFSGDTVGLQGNQNSGGNLTVLAGAALVVEFIGFDGGA